MRDGQSFFPREISALHGLLAAMLASLACERQLFAVASEQWPYRN